MPLRFAAIAALSGAGVMLAVPFPGLAQPASLQPAPPLAAQGCLGCHGPNGAGSQGIPGLAGREKAELTAALAAFRANERPGTIMGRVARGYTSEEIAAIAEHFSKLQP